MADLSKEEVIRIFTHQLPEILDEHPDLEPQLYHIFLKTFARKEEVAALHLDLAEFREETRENFRRVDQRFEQVDQRFEQVDQRLDGLRAEMRQGFQDVAQRIEQLGARWGIRSESLFRETTIAILEKSFDSRVETRHIEGEQFDLIITNGHHILVEIAASAPPNIVQRLERKRELYTRAVGVAPTRFVFAVASIHSRRAEALREAGFEVIEPEE
ncbi:MAG TPA: DUF3782 domain-containing protein [Anaerolineae bacterium]